MFILKICKFFGVPKQNRVDDSDNMMREQEFYLLIRDKVFVNIWHSTRWEFIHGKKRMNLIEDNIQAIFSCIDSIFITLKEIHALHIY